jgi:hypothetical protein
LGGALIFGSPGVVGMTAVVEAFRLLETVIRGNIAAFEDMAENLGPISGQIAQQRAQQDILDLEQRFRFADRYGPDTENMMKSIGTFGRQIREFFAELMLFVQPITQLLLLLGTIIIGIATLLLKLLNIVTSILRSFTNWISGNEQERKRARFDDMMKDLVDIPRQAEGMRAQFPGARNALRGIRRNRGNQEVD